MPNMALDAGYLGTVLGMRATKGLTASWWEFTLAACTQCGNTLIFTTDAKELSARIPGSRVIQVGEG